MNDPQYDPSPTDDQYPGLDQLYARMLESAAAIISFYAQQMPGCTVDRQRSLTRAMRRIRNDRTRVVTSDPRMILQYLQMFDAELAEEQLARSRTSPSLFEHPPTDAGAT